jgi:Xaa-Pro aminopeptidase
MTDILARVRAALDEANLDALYVACPVDDLFGQHSQNRRYLSGFSGSAGSVIVTRGRAILAVDFRYVEQAERESVPRGFTLYRTQGRVHRWLAAFCGEFALAGKRVGLSRPDLSYQDFVAMQEVVEQMAAAARPVLVPAPPILEIMRQVKTPAELAAMQRAIDIADDAFHRAADVLAPGQTERAVADTIAAAVRDLGGDGVSFATIVAAGPWGAMPHAHPRDVAINSAESVVIDMGARASDYCSDLTRTITTGGEPARFGAIYEIVLEAQQTAIERVEPGMTGVRVHDLAHDVIKRHGYGEQFGHGLGHGIGLQVHEAPYLGPTSEDTLLEGMVFSIEPGIYLPGWGGVRIEDLVVLENGKARVLSHARKRIAAGVHT